MKILVVIDHFKEGGAERVASILINRLCLEHQVYTAVVETGINYPLNLNQITYINLSINIRFKPFRILGRFYNLLKLIRKVKPDLILSFGNYMSIYTSFALEFSGKRKEVRYIASERTDPTREPSNKIVRLLRDKAYNMCDCLVCQTSWVVDYFKERINTGYVTISNPITPHLPVWMGMDSHVIMTACRLERQKNLPMLLEAFQKLHQLYPQIRLKIFGEGSLKDFLIAKAQVLGISNEVSFLGFSKNIHQEMVNSYMYVSSSDYEGISNSMLEALGCGVPTICTDCPVGGASMFIRSGENGLLVPVGDEKSLFKAMKQLIENKTIAIQFSQRSFNINDKISVENIVRTWLDVIEKNN
jgi:hypothetical protein